MAKQYSWTNADGLTLGGGRNSPDTSTPKYNAELSQTELEAVQALVSDAGIRAVRAWRAQPKTYKLVAVPTPTHYINSVTGSDANAGTSAALAKQTISPAFLTTLPAGSCIALSNNSLFDLSNGISFTTTGSLTINGASETSRITFTNYDPGGYPTQRPRIRFRYVPLTSDWTYDGAAQAWYYTNPNARAFGWSSLVRLGGLWGINYASAGLTSVTFPKIPYAAVPGASNRMYVWAPSGTDPTTYYGGTGSVVLGEFSNAAIGMGRTGKFVTFDNIVFEECGIALLQTNSSGSENLPSLVIQNCTFLNCGQAFQCATSASSAYTTTVRMYNNTFIGMGGVTVQAYAKSLNWEIAGNYFKQGNQSASYGGFIYAQEQDTGGTTAHGNNTCYENYFEDAKFNTSLVSLYDGSAFYLEERGKGWTVTRNFFAKMHAGIQSNSGEALIVTHNVFDDVDCPASFYDAGNTNTNSLTFQHNTCINIGLTKYRPAGSLDPAQAAIGAASNIDAGTLTVQNNLFQFTGGGAVVRPRTGLTVTATNNQVVGATGVVLSATDITQFQATPAGTDTTSFVLDPGYVPTSGVSAGAAIAALPTPVDIFGVRQVLPLKGAVAV